MMRLEATGLGKHFSRHWVFRNLHISLQEGERVLLCGDNGSGKSTLMRILSGQLIPSEGSVRLLADGKPIDPEEYYRHLSWSGPYMELYTDLDLREAIRLHASFRPMMATPREVAQLLELEEHHGKLLKHFSSGMLHRVKVGLAILTRSRLLLLDEATTNMDPGSSALVLGLMDRFLDGRLLVYASNKEEEFAMFDRRVVL
jgi:ABC-type multidrug transport system ATPase subunit